MKARRIGIDEAFTKAKQVLSQNRTALDRGAELLLQKETLNERDLRGITRVAGATAEVSSATVRPAQTPAA